MRLENINSLALAKLDNNRYILAIVVARRVSNLYKGAKVLIDDADKKSYFDVALEEIVRGLVSVELLK